ncbi:hypothetical protein AGR7A_Cc10030 [Agrobacterium deltaense NCPPB 1641]|uniref:Uncharacterized protein n=1 Tax=Agrobacterium deltaense NCPPB 1641 TaxID=1183425 RepID=A0A1S7TIB4_9HYPH|nr:hypothetical protein AGR7A_Cc10030 [Agrobacterium deltaense NCPPB 1641]
MPEGAPAVFAVRAPEPTLNFPSRLGSHDAPPLEGQAGGVGRVEQPIEILPGYLCEWQADIFEKVLTGEVEHAVGRSRPCHCWDQIDDRIGFLVLVQLCPSPVCAAQPPCFRLRGFATPR